MITKRRLQELAGIKVNKNLLIESKINNKDWDRMMILILKNDDGHNISKKINKKDKAINRFVAGLKLLNETPNYNKTLKGYNNNFYKFGDKALELGATPEEIEQVFNETQVPDSIKEKMEELKNSGIKIRFISNIIKNLLKKGYKTKVKKSNKIYTYEGKDAMSRNGANWTIGYEMIINRNDLDKPYKIYFDAITDEGFRRPTKYVFSNLRDPNFKFLNTYGNSQKVLGQRQFIDILLKSLK